MDIGLPQFQDYMAKMCTSHTSIRDIGLPKFKTSPLRLRSTLKWRKEKEQNLWKEIYKKEDRNNNRIILVYVHIGDETLILSYFLRYFLWKWEHTILYPMLQQRPPIWPRGLKLYTPDSTPSLSSACTTSYVYTEVHTFPSNPDLQDFHLIPCLRQLSHGLPSLSVNFIRSNLHHFDAPDASLLMLPPHKFRWI